MTSERQGHRHHTGRLILAPRDPWAAPNRACLIDGLRSAGFIGGPISGVSHAFSIGSEFLSLVSFVGCAVALPTDAAGQVPRCHVSIPLASQSPRWLTGRNTRPPRCRECRARLIDWTLWLSDPIYTGVAAEVCCPSCGRPRPLWEWDWREQGGFARQPIQVEEVFPGEAVATPALVALLGQCGGFTWHAWSVQDEASVVR
jgi:hypothetical protein